MVKALQTNYLQANLTQRQRALLDYAAKLTCEPWAMTEADLEPLRMAGLTDRAILDLNQVTAYCAYVNRVADGLGVVLDDYTMEDPS